MRAWHEWREAPPCHYAVIGAEISHSRSPAMHEAAYRALGLDLSYGAVQVAQGEVEPALDRLGSIGCRGVNVTVGLKEEALAWAEARGGRAGREIGAWPRWGANTLSLLTGQAASTDEPGFMAVLQGSGAAKDLPVLLLGAGGTGRALAARLCEEGWTVRAWNRTPGKWEEAARTLDLNIEVVGNPSASEAGAIVNCTSAGLHDDDLPVDWSGAGPGLVAMDLVYGRETRFMAKARAAGARTLDGSLMLVEQGALSFQWWLNASPSREAMLEAIQDGDS